MKKLFLVIYLSGLILIAESKPNFVYFLADDQRFDFSACSGHPVLKTPSIDKLAEQGTMFTNTTVTTSTCWISRASILTGMRIEGHRYNYKGRGKLAAKWADLSFSTKLRKSGYKFIYIGKNHISYNKGDTDKMYDEYIPVGRRPYFKKQKDGSKKHTTDIIGDTALTFLAEKHKKPFCLYLNFNAAHAEDGDKKFHYPYPVRFEALYKGQKMPLPKLYDQKYYDLNPSFLKKSMHHDRYKWRWDTAEKYQHNMRNYLRMISGIDSIVSQVKEALKKRYMHSEGDIKKRFFNSLTRTINRAKSIIK